MNIGLLTNYYLDEIGGAETALDCLAGWWDRMGHAVTVFSAPGRPRVPRRPWKPDYERLPIPRPFSTRFGLGRYARKIIRRHLRGPFDVLLASDAYWAGYAVHLAARRLRLPYVLFSHGSDVWEHSRFLRRPLCRRRMKLALSGAAAVVVVSQHLADRLAAEFGELGAPVHVIGNGWPDEWATLPAPQRLVLPRYLLAMGRLVEEKGFQVLVAAYAMLRRHHPDVALVIAGAGPFRDALVAEVRCHRLPVATGPLAAPCATSGVVFAGAVEAEVRRSLYWHAEIVVCPSLLRESQCMVVQEAMCHGVPVVASNLGGIPELVHDGVNGALFPPGGAEVLEERLRGLLSSPAYYQRLKSHTRQTAWPLRWSDVARRHLCLLEQAAVQGQPSFDVSIQAKAA
jgi:glycogen(starch) synthase